ncbi:MAG: hypothetical protein EZS28_047245, partial [Streblomastix strix]
QVQTHEQVERPLAPSGALVQCAPSFVSQVTVSHRIIAWRY